MKKIALSLIFSLLLLSTSNVNASDEKITKGKDVFVTVNGKDKTEQDLYNMIEYSSSYSPLLDVLDLKVMSEQYKNDSRLKDLIEKKYKEKVDAAKETDPNLKNDYALFNATNKEDYIKKSGVLLEAYREIAKMETAYNQLFSQEQKDYIYNNRFSGTAKIYSILVSPSLSSNEAQDQTKIDDALSKALQEAEKIESELKKGEDFKKLANEKSSDKLRKDGYLGEFNVDSAKSAKLDQAIINTAFALEDKQFSAPVKTQYGYEIVYVEYTKEKPKYEDVEQKVMSILYDMYTKNNPNTANYALELYRSDNKLEIKNNVFSKNYANSFIQTKKSYMQYDPNNQNPYGY